MQKEQVNYLALKYSFQKIMNESQGKFLHPSFYEELNNKIKVLFTEHNVSDLQYTLSFNQEKRTVEIFGLRPIDQLALISLFI